MDTGTGIGGGRQSRVGTAVCVPKLNPNWPVGLMFGPDTPRKSVVGKGVVVEIGMGVWAFGGGS